MSNETVGVGIIGCGDICKRAYAPHLAQLEGLRLVALADADLARAELIASEHPASPAATTPDALLARDDVQIVVNLTPPGAHAELGERVLRAGKHLYTEKPLCSTAAEARHLLALADEHSLSVACAPDTVLGRGVQTCARLVRSGRIGRVVGGVGAMTYHGPESWHPDPQFFYKRGGGPLLDMGPYYLTTLVLLLGPIASVTGSARASFPTRTITSEPHKGELIEVEIPTHVSTTLEFASGALVTLVMSFDTWAASLPRIELFGEHATLSVPDPNTFDDGPVRLFDRHDADDAIASGWAPGPKPGEWQDVEMDAGPTLQGRGLGLQDQARAITEGGEPKCSGRLALHVLEAMEAVIESAAQGRRVYVKSDLPMAVGANA